MSPSEITTTLARVLAASPTAPGSGATVTPADLHLRADDLADLRAAVGTLTADDLDAVAVVATALEAGIGDLDAEPDWDLFAALPDRPGRPMGLLPLVALVATAPAVLAHQLGRGMPRELAVSGLGDLGQQVSVHRLTYGGFGVHTQGWLTSAWSGGLVWIGRLQYNIVTGPSGHRLSAHIPSTGPLTGIEESFEAAREYAREFLPWPVVGLHCDSWLLDPDLAAAVPGSRMAAFQGLWSLSGDPQQADEAALFFTFRRRGRVDLDTLPQDTTLQRAIVARLRAGGHWHSCSGTIDW